MPAAIRAQALNAHWCKHRYGKDQTRLRLPWFTVSRQSCIYLQLSLMNFRWYLLLGFLRSGLPVLLTSSLSRPRLLLFESQGAVSHIWTRTNDNARKASQTQLYQLKGSRLHDLGGPHRLTCRSRCRLRLDASSGARFCKSPWPRLRFLLRGSSTEERLPSAKLFLGGASEYKGMSFFRLLPGQCQCQCKLASLSLLVDIFWRLAGRRRQPPQDSRRSVWSSARSGGASRRAIAGNTRAVQRRSASP